VTQPRKGRELPKVGLVTGAKS